MGEVLGVVTPIDVPCSMCGVEAGVECRDLEGRPGDVGYHLNRWDRTADVNDGVIGR